MKVKEMIKHNTDTFVQDEKVINFKKNLFIISFS